MMMSKPDMVKLARETASKYALPADIIMAICEQESSWDTWSIRYEPDFYIRYVKPLDLDATSSFARSTSWGLMQVMGQVAREIGFVGPLPALCDPETGIEWGCRVFMKKMAMHGGNVRNSLQAYNGGSNASYALEVMQKSNYYRNSNLA